MLNLGDTILITPGAKAELELSAEGPGVFLARHARGDWGDLCEEDKGANDTAYRCGEGRILSSYKTKTGEKIWIITEADRSATTILLPEEY